MSVLRVHGVKGLPGPEVHQVRVGTIGKNFFEAALFLFWFFCYVTILDGPDLRPIELKKLLQLDLGFISSENFGFPVLPGDLKTILKLHFLDIVLF